MDSWDADLTSMFDIAQRLASANARVSEEMVKLIQEIRAATPAANATSRRKRLQSATLTLVPKDPPPAS